MVNEYIDDYELGALAEQINNISISAGSMERAVDEIRQAKTRLAAERIVEKFASILAIDLLERNLWTIAQYEILSACEKTVEYNYQPYVDHLLNAVNINLNEIVRIRNLESNLPLINVDFRVLGDVRRWIDVVRQAKTIMRKKGVELSPEAASVFWKWLYGVGREGKKMPTRTRERKGKKGKAETVKTDYTEKYINAYKQTIATRIGLLGMNEAPFWEFIDKGNVNFSVPRATGTPYPTFSPTNLRFKIEEQLRDLWDRFYSDYYYEGEDLINDILDEESDIIDDEGNVDESKLAKVLEKVEAGIERGEISVSPTGQVDYTIRTTNLTIEFYIKSGKIHPKGRSPAGLFKTLIRN